jgi:hypothetical protein
MSSRQEIRQIDTEAAFQKKSFKILLKPSSHQSALELGKSPGIEGLREINILK